jgi:hypothetical protein
MTNLAYELTAEQKLSRVRNHLKNYLQNNPYFLSLPQSQQLSLYRDMLDNGLRSIESGGFARALAEAKDKPFDPLKEYKPPRIEDVGGIAGEFLEEVDFPQFVRDLITGVYGSIVQSSIQQMQAYVEMYKGLAKPLAAIARDDISDADALGQIAADNPLRFSMTRNNELFDNDEQMTLDQSNEEVQRMMYQAKLALAKERRLLLRETMLMGVQRLVVEKGTIRAGLIFDITSKESFRAAKSETSIKQTASSSGGGFFGFFGGGSRERETKITVSSGKLITDTELKAKITGHVEVNFKSDYFRLDNFANLFGNEEIKALIAQRSGTAVPGQAPAPGQVPAPAQVPAPTAAPAPAMIPAAPVAR